jgi:hypothetical protein
MMTNFKTHTVNLMPLTIDALFLLGFIIATHFYGIQLSHHLILLYIFIFIFIHKKFIIRCIVFSVFIILIFVSIWICFDAISYVN